MGVFTLTIGGVEKQTDLALGFSVSRPANGQAFLRGRIKSDDGSYRPALDAEVVLEDDGTVILGGEVDSTRESGLGGGGAIVTEIQTRGFAARTKRQYMTESCPQETLKARLTRVVAYIHGCTLDAAQVDGPTLPAHDYADVLVEEVMAHLIELTGGWIWQIDADEVLSMFEPGTIAAPFNITDANWRTYGVGDITVEPTRHQYANRIIVRTATLRVVVEDAGDIATKGPWELLISAPDTTTETEAGELGTAMLARTMVELKRVQYPTFEPGLEPGMTQTIALALRGLNNTFLILSVESHEAVPGKLLHVVQAVEGLAYQTGWREEWRQWVGGGNTLAIAGAGSTGAALASRFAYWLGATGVDAVETDGANWFAASGMYPHALGKNPTKVQVNTVARGTVAATVTGSLQSDSVGATVKARLYDVTDSVAVGESAEVVIASAAEWALVTFGVSLTPGSHLYELNVWSDTAGAWVRAGGFYLE